MARYEKGTPILFLVASPLGKGRVNVKVIDDLENFLIQNAKAKNPHLVNKTGTKEADWAIQGVVRRKGGKTSASARALRSVMGFEHGRRPQRPSLPGPFPLHVSWHGLIRSSTIARSFVA